MTRQQRDKLREQIADLFATGQNDVEVAAIIDPDGFNCPHIIAVIRDMMYDKLPEISNMPDVKERVEGRKVAKTVLSLADECSIEMWTSGRKEANAAFWEEIRDDAMRHAPLPVVEPKLIRARPMTDDECGEFGKETIPFGQCGGMRVGNAMRDDQPYLKWLADQTFIDDLRRYLANETIARHP